MMGNYIIVILSVICLGMYSEIKIQYDKVRSSQDSVKRCHENEKMLCYKLKRMCDKYEPSESWRYK